MRVRLPVGRALIMGGAFAVALVAMVPLRLAAGWMGLDGAGLSAREVVGSVWSGRLSEVRLANVPLGDLRAGVDPLPLLAGRARVNFERPEKGADALEGAISVGRHEMGLDDVTARLPLGRAFAPLPAVAIDLNDVSVRFRDGLCLSAEGRARATIAGEMAQYLMGGGLSGNVRCEGGALLLPLVSQSGMVRVAVRLFGGSRYRAELLVRSGAESRDGLLGAGFAPRGDGYILSVDGVF